MVELLLPGGWFINADLIVADSPELESRLQELRVAGIVERAGGSDNRFADSASTRQFLLRHMSHVRKACRRRGAERCAAGLCRHESSTLPLRLHATPIRFRDLWKLPGR